jgi:hypothetical protein
MDALLQSEGGSEPAGGSEPFAGCSEPDAGGSELIHLLHLPVDALQHIALLLEAPDLIVLSRTAHGLRAVAESDPVWRHCFQKRFAHVHAYLYPSQPVVSLPEDVATWKRHYLEFDLSWVSRAHKECGRVLMRINGRLYDVTEFVDDHPGDPQLLTAAAGLDATDAFDYVGHSSQAVHLLQSMEVPELNLLPTFRRVEKAALPLADETPSASPTRLGKFAGAVGAGLARARDGLTFLSWGFTATGSWRQSQALQLLKAFTAGAGAMT